MCKLENKAILRGFLKFLNVDNISKTQQFCETSSSFWTWQRQRWNKSVRLLHFSKLTASKTKQFCETSFKNGKLSAGLTASYQCVLRFFHSICVKCCACHEKVNARSYEVLHLSRKIILANLKIWCSIMQPFSWNQRPGRLTSLMNMSVALRLPRECIFPDPLEMSHACHRFWKFATKPSDFAHFWRGAESLPRETILNVKSGLNMLCFQHFDLEMCFAPQRRALFRQLNFLKGFRTLRCFVTLVHLRHCASRHHGVQLLIIFIHLARCAPRPVRF